MSEQAISHLPTYHSLDAEIQREAQYGRALTPMEMDVADHAPLATSLEVIESKARMLETAWDHAAVSSEEREEL